MNIQTYRINPDLFLYCVDSAASEDQTLLIERLPPRSELKICDPRLGRLIEDLPQKFSLESYKEKATQNGIRSEECEDLWQFLLASETILSSDEERWLDQFDIDEQHPWYQSLRYHSAMRDFPFLDMGVTNAALVDNEIMKRYAGTKAPPSVYQNFNTGKGMRLTFVEDHLNRKEGVARGPVLKSLTVLLDVAFGERSQHRENTTEDGYFEMRKLLMTVPSGGGRHPAEAFLVNLTFEGLAAGLYHYSVEQHTLEYLGDVPESLVKQSGGASAFLCIAPVLERAMWRYREPRSWRAVLVDTGHCIGALLTMAKTCGLNAHVEVSFDLEAITRDLKLDGSKQPILAILSLNEGDAP